MSPRGYLFLKLETLKSRVTEIFKKPGVIKLKESQHVKGSEALLESAVFSSYFLITLKGNQLKKFRESSN